MKEFKCKSCKAGYIEEVQTGIICYSTVTELELTTSGALAVDYDGSSNYENGSSSANPSYQCGDCGVEISENELKLLAGE